MTGADSRGRTGGLHLGKVALYLLSYARKWSAAAPVGRRGPPTDGNPDLLKSVPETA